MVHIQAGDFARVGYALAYSFAENNGCMLADSFPTVRVERSRFFGPEVRSTRAVNGEYGAAFDFSYSHLVSFNENAPHARGLLVYGQSTNPRSPCYAHQLPLYASKRLPLLPFSAAAIAADPGRRMRKMSEP